MLLKVRSFPSGTGPSTPKSKLPPPLHICLATSNQETGICLSVGRKEGDVVFELDKSVSRRDHCKLKFISGHEEDGDAFACETPEQSEALDPLHKMGVVIESVGKTGTLLVHEETEMEAPQKKQDDDSATVDSAETTDDPYVSQSSLATPGYSSKNLSDASREFLGEAASRARFDLLISGKAKVLKPLAKPKGRVVFQCGKMGATIIIERCPDMVLVKSGFPKRKLSWIQQLHHIGASEAKEWDADVVNMLVTPKRISSFKTLSAWVCQCPVVAPSYLEAFLERTNAKDPLPDPKDHEPVSTVETDAFWNTRTPSRNMLRGTTFISVKEGEETEGLVASAGATVFKFYDEPDYDLSSINGGFALDGRRKLTTQIKKAGFPAVAAKVVARAITEQDPSLIDGSLVEHIAAAAEKADQEKKRKEKDTVTKKPSSPAADDTAGEDPGQPASAKDSMDIGSEKSPGKDLSPDKDTAMEESTTEATSLTTTEKGRKKRSNSENECADEALTKRKRDQADDDGEDIGGSQGKKSRTTHKSKSSSQSQSSQWFSTQGGVVTETPRQADESDNEARDTVSVEKEKESRATQPKPKTKTSKPKSKKPRLSQDSSGWLVTAPKDDKKRQALKRSDQEIEEYYEETPDLLLKAARTKVMKGMVGPPKGQYQATTRARRNRAKPGVPDYKAFCKNAVPVSSYGANTARKAKFKLRVHRTKESAADEFAFQEQQQALEEQQRRADALFRDSRAKTAAGRRRRNA